MAPAESIALTGQYFVADSSMQRAMAAVETPGPSTSWTRSIRVKTCGYSSRCSPRDVDPVGHDRLALLERDADHVHRGARRERREDGLDRAQAALGRVVEGDRPPTLGLGIEMHPGREGQFGGLDLGMRSASRSADRGGGDPLVGIAAVASAGTAALAVGRPAARSRSSSANCSR